MESDTKNKASQSGNTPTKPRSSLIALGSPAEDFLHFPRTLLTDMGQFAYHTYKSIDDALEGGAEIHPQLCLVDGRNGTNVAAEWSQALRMTHPEAEIWVLYGAENPLDTSVLKKNGARQVFHVLFDAEFFVTEALNLFAAQVDMEEPPLDALESVSADDFDNENEINFDVYVHLPAAKKSILVRKKGSLLDQRIQENSKKTGQSLFVKKTELKNFFEYARTVRSARNDDQPTTLTETLYKTKKHFYLLVSSLLDAQGSDFQTGKTILATVDQILSQLEVLKRRTPKEALARMKQFTGHPSSHYQNALNVCIFSTSLAEIFEFSPEKTKTLSLAGLLHNLGLSQLPTSTFGKEPSHYLPEEMESFKHYPEKSVYLVKAKKVALDPPTTNAIVDHAENADRSGFPKGKAAEDTDDLAKILHLACRLNDLTCNQVGKHNMSLEEAIEFIRKETFTGTALHDLVTMTQLMSKLKPLL